MSMNEQISQSVANFMQVLEKTTAEALSAQADSVKASAELALLMQRCATQQVVLGSYLQQRSELLDLVDQAGGPMTTLLEAQIASLDARAVEVMHNAGVPKRAAQEALAAFSAARFIEAKPANGSRLLERKNGTPLATIGNSN